MLANRIRGVLAALALLVSSVVVVLPSSASAHHRPHHAHHRVHHHRHTGIPQHGGGDHDADNFGGPSDGDGNV